MESSHLESPSLDLECRMGRSPEPLEKPLPATGVGRGNRMAVGEEGCLRAHGVPKNFAWIFLQRIFFF